jgi:hypothetical protein
MQIFGQHPFLAQYVLPAFVASIVIAVFSVLRNIWVARMRFRTLISKGMVSRWGNPHYHNRSQVRNAKQRFVS